MFETHGIKDIKGILEFPKLRKTTIVTLIEEDRQQIGLMLSEIEDVCQSEYCPPLTKKERCRQCSYYEFCYTKEMEQI